MEHYELRGGLYVSAVSDVSYAKEKGIVPGDIITAVNGTAVKTTEEISRIKDTLEVGDGMTLTIWRDGESLDITIVLVDTNDVYS